MARHQSISLSQRQRLQLNTGLQTAIALLRMDAGGLTRYLEEQAERNGYLTVDAPPLDPSVWTPRWTSAFHGTGHGTGGEMPDTAQPGPSLMAHVLSQIETVTKSERERGIALVLAEAIEPSGWLGRPLPELAVEARCSVGDAEAVLRRLQRMEPTGLFARSLAECLRLQAAEADRLDPVMVGVLDNLELLAEGRTARLAQICGATEAEVLARLRVIRSFDPKPGAQFEPGTVDAREPDLTVTAGPQGWEVALNRSALPAVSVRRPGSRPAEPEERAALAEALGLRRMLEQRNATLLRVAQEVILRQHAVLDHGLGALQPLGMAEVAQAVGLHESTISRTVAGVALSTPVGTFALRGLFGPRVGDTSAAAIRAEIARLVAAEDPAAPLSDLTLTDTLAASGRAVARRTVAKYRAQLRIPTAGQRRRARRK
jgi:RNA polymerase sigma-54 factor